ncbi:hypothetical protein K2224_14350 [Streptomyces sp. BHT-5-2]|uniref:hypothetical protein n=1 Tax=Streptomyces sp. BHT-5-2 TaxID=2866715 RepID=UPI001C8D3F6E|nr:hypothetical protein [Streptomyces sp. BHT-5-2]QZL04230.1 hypothetical protein K2224_14350 [Streptomyces sp. BHT-5-2]
MIDLELKLQDRDDDLAAARAVRHDKRAELSTDQLRALLAVVQGEAAGSVEGM